ncbi:MAG: AbrB/MazE/SpoVT family DNA-binding domain-containing protein [Candidatus Hodarchaeales archaeon]|jgi:hypothetical protein
MEQNKNTEQKEKICPNCEKGKLIHSESIITEINGYIFVEKGEICSDCREEFIDEKYAQQTIEIARKLGIWPEPLKLYRKLSKSGNSLTLRIPADLERQLNLKPDTEVAISKIGNKIIIEPSN